MPILDYHSPHLERASCIGTQPGYTSLKKAFALAGAPMDGEIEKYFTTYCDREQEQRLVGYDSTEFYRRLLFIDGLHSLGNKISDIVALLGMVGIPKIDLAPVDEFRRRLNEGLLSVHPGPNKLNAQELMGKYKGAHIKIAIYDLFDPLLLLSQRQQYKESTIREVINFGNPVRLAHGNSVIDIILGIAPQAEIIPISSDTNFMTQAVIYLQEQEDIFVVNMSRALKESAERQKLDQEFAREFSRLLRDKIVVKSLGNSGTDLCGEVSPARKKLGLDRSGDFSSFDAFLIADLVRGLENDNLILAQSWSLAGERAALSATVAGDNISARERSVGAPAEGVYSLSTGNFEFGSSFAAPQISAIAALAIERQLKNTGKVKAQDIARALRNDELFINVAAQLGP